MTFSIEKANEGGFQYCSYLSKACAFTCVGDEQLRIPTLANPACSDLRGPVKLQGSKPAGLAGTLVEHREKRQTRDRTYNTTFLIEIVVILFPSPHRKLT